MYIIELGTLRWEYDTAEEAWCNRHLEVRKSCPPMNLNDVVVTGVRAFEEFKKLLDEGKVLQYHALTVQKE